MRHSGKHKFDLNNLPLDVLFEILGFLHPSDVLRMARISKNYRARLMHRSAKPIWRSAFLLVDDLPLCPNNLSLPGWASLLYSLHCHNCLSRRVRSVSWILQVRLCAKCSRFCLRNRGSFDHTHESGRDVLQSVVFGPWPGKAGKYCLVSDFERFSLDIRLPGIDDANFVTSCIQKVYDRTQHAVICEQWANAIYLSRSGELDRIRVTRASYISTRLASLGYSPELLYLDELRRSFDGTYHESFVWFDKHKLVRLAKSLSPRGWLRIQPELVCYMENVRIHRLRLDRSVLLRLQKEMLVDAWSEFQRFNSLEQFMPSHVDLEDMPLVQSVLESTSNAQPTLDIFHAVVRAALPSIYAWRTTRLESILLDVQMHLPDNCGTAGLQLVVCVFCCIDTTRHTLQSQHDPMQGSAMWYPEYLYHSCNNVVKGRPPTDNIRYTDVEVDNLGLRAIERDRGYYRAKWDSHLLMFNVCASRAVREILEVFGVDYRTTTVTDLDAYDTLIYCSVCNAPDQSVWLAMPWRLAVKHRLNDHWSRPSLAWLKIPDTDGPCGSPLTIENGLQCVDEGVWRCGHCRDKPDDIGKMTKAAIDEHFKLWHHFKDYGELDYYRALDVALPHSRSFTVRRKS